MVVLDTDFLIDLMRRHAGAVETLDGLLESPDSVGVSVISIMQLYHGVARAAVAEAEAAKIEGALKGLATYDMTREIAMSAGRVDGELASRGQAIDPADVIIGATALHRGEPLVTRNARHFSRIKGLRILGY